MTSGFGGVSGVFLEVKLESRVEAGPEKKLFLKKIIDIFFRENEKQTFIDGRGVWQTFGQNFHQIYMPKRFGRTKS